MNFDGTYRDESQANTKLLEAEKPAKPPVRVIVSYPQSEEWDGKNTKSCTACKWLIIIALVVIIAASCVLLYFFVIKESPTNHGRPEIKTQKYVLNDEDTKKYFLNQVKDYYDGVKREQSYADQLNFFRNETETLKLNNLTLFVNELKIAIPLLLPDNIDVRTSIINTLYSYTQHAKEWLEYVIKYETNLMSYDFQKNNEDQVGDFAPELDNKEIEELKRLRAKYTKPMEKKKVGNRLEFYKTAVVFSDVVNSIPGNNSIQQVSIIATIIHMDCNLTRNIDLAIFAADWRFQLSVYIDLSGADAPHTDLSIKNGENGGSGKNGGYFIGSGKVDLNMLHITSNGGAAAAGHHGADGKNGTPNLELIPLPQKTSDFECECCIANNDTSVNHAGEIVQSYRLYNEHACAEEGLKGGKAGEPGLGGHIFIILPHKYEKRKGRNGAQAAQGIDGNNGKSATERCYLGVYQVDLPTGTGPSRKRKWFQYTSKICNNATLLPIKKKNLNTRQKEIRLNKNLTQLISAFDNFSKQARDNLEYENDNQLFLLLENIESNSAVKNFTSAFLLFDEFVGIEKNYTKVEIFRSFYKKVHYVLNITQDLETKNALEYLQFAIWTKMSYLRNSVGELYIVDIDKYLSELLETIERLDVNTLELPSLDNESKRELVSKFDKIKKSLEATNQLVCDPSKSTDRLTCLLSMLSKILSNVVEISIRLLDETQVYDPYQTITNLINAYKENVIKYFPLIENNGTACSGMSKESCIELNRTKSFEKMERAILRALDQFNVHDVPLEFSHVVNVILRQIHESRASSPTMHFLIRDFRDATEDLSALLQSSNRFLFDKYLQTKLEQFNGKKFKDKSILKKVARTKDQMMESILRDQYMRALHAYQQWAFPFMDTIEVIRHDAKKSELINGIKAIKDARSRSQSTINDRDSQIIKAEFKGKDTFYTWNNQQYNSLITQLLSGVEVTLRANLFDSYHVVNKQAIKFQSVELRLTGIPKSIINEYNVNLIHSGYSNYVYNGSAITIVGPELQFMHSFDHNRRSGAPLRFSSSLEKVKTGEIKLSPYTSWTVRLERDSQDYNFSNLHNYVNVTDVHLVGSGSYVRMPSTVKQKTL